MQAAKPDRSLLVVVAIIAALVLVALIVVFARGEPPLRDASTPEGVVQRYAAAVIDGDIDAASDYLTEDASENCDQFERGTNEGIRVTLLSTNEHDRSAEVRVTLTTYFDGGPFGASEYTSEDEFRLVKQDGDWLVQTAPWQLSVCPR